MFSLITFADSQCLYTAYFGDDTFHVVDEVSIEFSFWIVFLYFRQIQITGAF